MTRVITRALIGLALLAAFTRAEAVNVYYRSTPVTLSPYMGGSAKAVCNSGGIALGGGWYGDSPDVFVYYSAGARNSWSVVANNLGGGYPTVSAWVACATDVGSASVYQASRKFTVPRGRSKCTDSTNELFCSRGGVPTAGGFIMSTSSPDRLYPYVSYESYPNDWTLCFTNPSGTDTTVTTYVTCALNLPGYVYTASTGSTNLYPGDYGYFSPYCSSGGWLISGGYYLAGGSSDLRNLRMVTDAPWDTIVYNGTSSMAWPAAYARCLRP
jgi:hypothetical protein